MNKFYVAFLILIYFLLSGERPSIDTSEQALKKRKALEDHVEFKKKRKKKESKTPTEDVPILIDLTENMPTTSGTETPVYSCKLFVNYLDLIFSPRLQVMQNPVHRVQFQQRLLATQRQQLLLHLPPVLVVQQLPCLWRPQRLRLRPTRQL